MLDPNDTMVEPHASSNGTLVMKEILAVAGPTPDPNFIAQYPDAVFEWCINAAAVDPITKAVMVNSEDGKVYRWDLATNTLSQAVTLSPGVGEAYTSTLIGPDGTVYATNWAILNAVGAATVTVTVARAGSGMGNVASSPGGIACGVACSAQFSPGLPITLNAASEFGSVFTGWLRACTGLGPCQMTPRIDSAVSATFAPDTVAPLRIDIDGNNTYDALTDGLLVIRYLSGLSGFSLTAGALGSGATLTDPTELVKHLNDIRPVFDVDGNGRVDPSSDGLMLIRYLFGLRGPSPISGAIGAGATRATSQDIENYIQSLMPL